MASAWGPSNLRAWAIAQYPEFVRFGMGWWPIGAAVMWPESAPAVGHAGDTVLRSRVGREAWSGAAASEVGLDLIVGDAHLHLAQCRLQLLLPSPPTHEHTAGDVRAPHDRCMSV